jgi:hypothetical protein
VVKVIDFESSELSSNHHGFESDAFIWRSIQLA